MLPSEEATKRKEEGSGNREINSTLKSNQKLKKPEEEEEETKQHAGAAGDPCAPYTSIKECPVGTSALSNGTSSAKSGRGTTRAAKKVSKREAIITRR